MRRGTVIVVLPRETAAASSARTARQLGLHGGQQHALLVVPACLGGVVERTTATTDVELEVLDGGARNRRALAASVGREHHAVAPRGGRHTARSCRRRIGRSTD